MANGKNKKQQIIALAIGGIAGLVIGRVLAPVLASPLRDLWYLVFSQPKDYLLAGRLSLGTVWLSLILLGAIAGYRLSRRISLRRIIGIALGAVVGVIVGTLPAIFLSAYLTDLVWYQHFDWPINTLLVTEVFLVAMWILLISLGALLGFLASDLLGRLLSLLPKRNKVKELSEKNRGK